MGLEFITPKNLSELKPNSRVLFKHPVVCENDFGESMVFYDSKEGLYEFLRVREYFPPVIESHIVDEGDLTFNSFGNVIYSDINLRLYVTTQKELYRRKSDKRFLERWNLLREAGLAKFPWEERK